ncbi:DNA ligase [Desulfonema magnum]|uniref:DNA ligase n=2 Tax=Desulfonema magnum TaxID=45655 RepID=A0A975BXW7_9BACT|nr:DNA ligase [Desulfonema magnum]
MRHVNKILLIFLVMIHALAMNALATDQEFAKKRIQKLSSEITRHDYLYYVLGKPEISDKAYDQLFDELVRLEKEFPDLVLQDSPSKRVGSELDNAFPQVPHNPPMLSLEKCYSAEEVISWAKKTQAKAGEKLSFVLEEKIDGTAIELIYKEGVLICASTRGNGKTGYDITNNARTIRPLPLRLNPPLSFTVRGEVFIKKADFARLVRESGASYDSARNLAAGALRKKNSSETAKIPLDIFLFEAVCGDTDDKTAHSDLLVLLTELGFRTNPNHQTVSNISDIKKYIEDAILRRDTLAYEIDGLVVKVNEMRTRKSLGSTERFPRWAVAYKFKSPEDETVVESIDLQVGRLGRITPVAKLRTVRIRGTDITRATLHNQDYISQLELAVGDTVKISRRGHVIPAVDQVVEKNTLGNAIFQMPTKCPVCKTLLKIKGKHHFCPNTDCPEQVKARLIWFSKKMKIKYLGPKTTGLLISQKQIQYPEDIYTLSAEDLKNLKGLGEKKSGSIAASIEKSKNNPFQVVLFALGIRGLGTKNIRLLTTAGLDSVDKILKAGTRGLSQIKGIGNHTASQIISGFTPRIMKTVKALKNAGLAL